MGSAGCWRCEPRLAACVPGVFRLWEEASSSSYVRVVGSAVGVGPCGNNFGIGRRSTSRVLLPLPFLPQGGKGNRRNKQAIAAAMGEKMWCAVSRTEMSRRIEPEWSLSSFRSLARQTALSTVAVGFEPCWPGAFSVDAIEQCRPATGLCGVCARKPAFLSTPQSSRSSCHVGVVRCQGVRLLFLAGTITSFVRSRIQRSLPLLRLS